MFLRFYRLDELPGEMFGDINENYEDIQDVLQGKFSLFFPRNTGREGMLFYLTAVVARFGGLNYLTQKFTTASVGIISVFVIYFFGKEYVSYKAGLLAAFLLATLGWHISYSRLGIRAILDPLFVMLTFIFFLKAVKRKNLWYFSLAGIFLGLGMYTYTAFRIMPLVVLTCFIGEFFTNLRKDLLIKGGLVLFLSFAFVFLPLGWYAQNNPQTYWGHSKRMMAVQGGIFSPKSLSNLVENIKSQAGMLYLRGDIVFRVNPTQKPQLDEISGLFFIIGLIYFLFKDKRKFLFLILVPFLLLQLPSVLVLNYPIDVPSSIRSIGIIPFVCLITALGILGLFEQINHKNKLMAKMFLGFILFVILVANYQDYFYTYALGLPNHNVAFGKIIAQQIDELPSDTVVYIYSSGWGDWGQPEPKGIKYALEKPREITFIGKGQFFCSPEIARLSKFYFVWDPKEQGAILQLKSCLPGGLLALIKSSDGDTIYLEYKDF